MSRRRKSLSIPDRANRILHLILIAFCLILLKCWNLAVIQHEVKKEEVKKPKRRSIIEPATRATIRDRFNIPLAINKVKYQASLLYPQIREIPSVHWERDARGNRVKRYARKEYVEELSLLLGEELSLDSERVEDLIHSKAVFYGNLPFVIKDDLSEEEYYRVKMLEKDWPGIHARRVPRRYYPKGKAASHLIGYMGAINRDELDGIVQEMETLQRFLKGWETEEEVELPEGYASPQEVQYRLADLEELAYGMSDTIGKMGIEAQFEEQLRGFWGKRQFEVDAKGRYLRGLPGYRPPISGQRVLLTISADLQEFAENLLIQNEALRKKRDPDGPWMRGGSIVAMDPKSGEVLAMASYPRFDPNDFIPEGNRDKDLEKQKNILRWFETESYLGQIWDQLRLWEKESFDLNSGTYIDEAQLLSWSSYLDQILPSKNPIRQTFAEMNTLVEHVRFQELVNGLLKEPESYQLKEKLKPFFSKISERTDQLLFTDLSRLVVRSEWFSEPVLYHLGNQTIDEYREATCSFVRVERLIRPYIKELFHATAFKEWRENDQENFLKEKRAEEKEAGRYHQPYLDHLDRKERELFNQFWDAYRWPLLYTFLTGRIDPDYSQEELVPFFQGMKQWEREIAQGAYSGAEWRNSYEFLRGVLEPLELHVSEQYLMTMRSFDELDRPLLGRYSFLRKCDGICLEKHLAMAFYPKYGYGYARSYAFRQATTQGSIFKVVTGYAALAKRYQAMQERGRSTFALNPLIIVDEVRRTGNGWSIGYFENGKPIPRVYKGGRMPKSLNKNIGKIDIVGALETSSNPYFSLLAGEHLEEPNDLADAARLFSYGSRTGIDLPGEISGQVPTDLEKNRTGLYSFAIGQHTLVATPLQTAVMLSAMVNGGYVFKPQIIKMIAGKRPDRAENLTAQKQHAYREAMQQLGIDFPLFSKLEQRMGREKVTSSKPNVLRRAWLPSPIQRLLSRGMAKAVEKMNLWALNQVYRDIPEAIESFKGLRRQMIGKTSSAESMERLNLDSKSGVQKLTHIWFGGVSYPENVSIPCVTVQNDASGDPELVVIVYLKYGGYGNHAAPLAAQIIQKWREINTSKSR